MRLLLVAVLLALAGFAPAQAGPPSAAPVEAIQRRFTVPLHGGHLQVDELLRALFRAYELDGDGLALPGARIDLRGAKGSALLFAGRKLLLETVRFRRDFATDELVVTIDRERTREVRRQLRERLAKFAARASGEQIEERRYELALPAVLDPQRPLVVLVHGVESGPESLADLREFLAAAPQRCQVATFAYPNDEAIDRVAAEFAARLRALGEQPVAVVGHSMGGLVARAVVEDPALDPGNVRMLVQIGTPNRGSDLAGLRVALEARSVLGDVDDGKRFARELLDAVIDHWRDGLGEAGGDLLPGSVFLVRLAERSRNPKVAYHLVLGTRGLVTAGQLAAVREEVAERLRGNGLGRFVQPRLEAWLTGLDEVVDGMGDGAVSVAAGRLDGVEAVLVPLDHLGLVRLRGLSMTRIAAAEHPVFQRVATWVAQVR